VFTCDSCGRDTFVRGVSPENPEEHAEAQRFFRELISIQEGLEAADLWDGELLFKPSDVTCSHCQLNYEVELDMFDSWDDDDDEFLDDEDEDLDNDWGEEEFDEDWDEDTDEDWDDDEDLDDYDL